MRPKRANSSVLSRCRGKHSTPCSPSARSTCLKSLSETGCARSIPSIRAPSALPLGWIFMPSLGFFAMLVSMVAPARPRVSIRAEARRARSVDADAAGLDRAGPLVDLVGDELGEILRTSTLRRDDALAEALEALAHRGRIQGRVDRLGETVHDRVRRSLRQEQALPCGHIEIEAL